MNTNAPKTNRLASLLLVLFGLGLAPLSGCDALAGLTGKKTENNAKDQDSEDDESEAKSDKKPKRKKKASAAASAAASSAPVVDDGKTFAAPSTPTMPAFTPGAFTRTRRSDAGVPGGDIVVEILSQEGNSYWVELELTKSARGPVFVQVLLDPKDRIRLDKIEVSKARLKMNGLGVIDVPKAQLGTQTDLMMAQLQPFSLGDLAKLPREDVTIERGTFKGCYVLESEATLLGLPTKQKAYIHPAVPINGLVKSVGVQAGKAYEIVLLDFGLSGAQKSF